MALHESGDIFEVFDVQATAAHVQTKAYEAGEEIWKWPRRQGNTAH